MELKERERKILSILMRMQTYVTGEELSNEIGVSLKTIQRDIANINQYFKNLENKQLITSSRGNGYVFNNKYRTLIDSIISFTEKKDIPVEPTDRIKWIITEYCFASVKNEAITLNQLADALFISTSTLKKDMQGVKAILGDYGLDLVKDGNKGLKLAGSENQIRSLLIEYLFKKIPFESNQSFPFHENKGNLSILLEKSLLEYGIHMTDIGMDNFIFHIQVALSRIQTGNFIKKGDQYPVHTDSKEYVCAKEISRRLEDMFQLSIPEEEVLNIFLHLSAQKTIVQDEELHQTIASFRNTEECEVIDEVLEVIDKIYGFHFHKDDVLRVGLLIHLRSALLRIKLGYPIRNEFLEDIQTNYPFAMQLAFFLANKIKEHMDIQIDLHETGYLALHFCGAMERMGKKEGKLRACLVCASGGGTAILLKSKLENAYRNRLLVQGVYSIRQISEIDFDQIDIIISTVRLQGDFPVPVLVVTPIVHEIDMQKINDFIYKKNNCLIVQDMMSKQLFYMNKDFHTKEEIIQFMSQQLVDLGYINQACQQSILEREKLASTEIGNMVAVPHNIGDGVVYRPSVSFMLLDHPVHWHHGDVKLVMMIAMDVNNNQFYKDVFLELYNKVNFQYKVDEIVNRKQFDYIYNLFI
ncbi:BglG family transcription antiterminator [Fervidibacillus albus]|uniref:PRD domain-containing protein n=1 Tax=Fervidibacillus albus TaxID=2980026 RepID=A0A9E8LTQ7_9BACI|nr:PRD domain-containing protein [Fervidibacillus albus]WAA09366.1 PRD domain-containing protein [Fervidibacillus albus]